MGGPARESGRPRALSTGPGTLIVDGHLHVFREAGGAYPRDVHPLFPRELEAPVEELLETMSAHGVDKAVLVALSPHDEYLRECLERHPGRFAAVGVHDAHAGDAVADLRRRVAESGIRGLRVHHLGEPGGTDARALEGFPLLRALADDDLALWFYAPADQLLLLEAALEHLPGLRVVLNHLGLALPPDFEVDEHGRPRVASPIPPPTLDTVRRLARFEGVHVMLSGQYAFSREPYPYSDTAEVVRAIFDEYGAERMLWASDYPWIRAEPSYGAQLALVDRHLPDLTEAERAEILGGTAQRVLRF